MFQQLEFLLRQIPWLQEAEITRLQLYLFAFSIFLVVLTLVRLMRRKRRAAGFRNLGVAVVIVMATLGWMITVTHFESYQPVHLERVVAQLQFKATDEQGHKGSLAKLKLEDKTHRWPITARQWQLNVRVISLRWPWQQSATARYRFQHFVAGTELEEGKLERRVFRLPYRQSLDVWRILHKYLFWLPVIETDYRQSPTLPVDTNQFYNIALLEKTVQVMHTVKVDSQ